MFKISVIACANKMPQWINDGVAHFKHYLTEYIDFKWIDLPAEKRTKSNSPQSCMLKEAIKIEQTIPTGSYVIALDSQGIKWDSVKLSEKLKQLPQHHPHLCLLIGGPDGIHPSLVAKTKEQWSLSALTFPHSLVRIILVETLYRAFSIIHSHPYHR